MAPRQPPDAPAVAALVARLRDGGVDAVWVDREPVCDKTSLLRALARELSLPDFGYNWGALEDALYGPPDPDAPQRLLVFRDLELLEERDPESARMFLEIVAVVAENPTSTLLGLVRAGSVANPDDAAVEES